MAYETTTPVPTRKDVEVALSPLDFPLSKEDLVRCTTGNGAPESVVHQVRALPLATYESADEVLRSVEVVDESTEQ
jgi:hypothetical protein